VQSMTGNNNRLRTPVIADISELQLGTQSVRKHLKLIYNASAKVTFEGAASRLPSQTVPASSSYSRQITFTILEGSRGAQC